MVLLSYDNTITSFGGYSLVDPLKRKMNMHYIDTNLDFEYEITLDQRPSNKHIQHRLHAWQHLLRLLPEHQQARPLQATTQLSPDDTLTTWGQTNRHSKHLPQNHPQARTWPDPVAVCLANSKITSHQLEQTCTQSAIPHNAVLEDLVQAMDWIEQVPHQWIIKHPFGVSGRDRISGKPGHIDERALGWLKKKLKTSPCVAEVWIDNIKERSTQLHLHPCGQLDILGTLELLTDHQGTFRGHHILQQTKNPLQTTAQLQTIGAHLHQIGYSGPLGIDAFTGTCAGQPCTRPIVEINARHTFGHLALALKAHIPKTFDAIWHHPDRHAKEQPTLPELTSTQTQPGLYRLPQWADPEHQTRSTIELIK